MKAVLAVLALAGLVASQDVSGIQEGSTCAGNSYSTDQIEQAAQQALSLWGQYQTVGNDKYPHKYNDYEGFSFSCPSPYLEFPIQEDGVYDGGSPGADRVVIGGAADDGSSGTYCGLITHTGASGNDFEECNN